MSGSLPLNNLVVFCPEKSIDFVDFHLETFAKVRSVLTLSFCLHVIFNCQNLWKHFQDMSKQLIIFANWKGLLVLATLLPTAIIYLVSAFNSNDVVRSHLPTIPLRYGLFGYARKRSDLCFALTVCFTLSMIALNCMFREQSGIINVLESDRLDLKEFQASSLRKRHEILVKWKNRL